MSNFFVDCVAPILLFIVCFLLTKLCAPTRISPTKDAVLEMSGLFSMLLNLSATKHAVLNLSATKDAVLKVSATKDVVLKMRS